MKKTPDVFIGHILESIEYIGQYMRGLSYDDFCASRQSQDAVVRRLEIIGEAVKNIPDDFKKAIARDVHFKKFLIPNYSH